jgi:hypothetical protein
VDFPVYEQPNQDRHDFSHKFRHAGLRYEVATALGCSKIVHIAGGIPCGAWPDQKIARECLLPRLGPDEKPAGDLGYSKSRFLTKFTGDGLTARMKAINHDIKLMGARHETVNLRLKTFECLNARIFRHSREFHVLVFTAVANLVQLNLEHEPLFALSLIHFI